MKWWNKGSGEHEGPDWYEAASAEDRREYNEFGPWLIRVQALEDMPKIFQPWFEAFRSSEYVFKIPIAADRRAVRPGMSLYQTVYAISETSIAALQNKGGEVIQQVFPMQSVRAIRNYTNLLLSELSLHIADGSVCTLPYNTVSSDEMDVTIHYLRHQLEKQSQAISSARKVDRHSTFASVDDPLYRRLLDRSFRRSASVQLMLWDKPGVCLKGWFWQHLFGLGCMILKEDGGIVVLRRGKDLRRRSETVYAHEDLYMPQWAIQEIAVEPQNTDTRQLPYALTFKLEGHTFRCVLATEPALGNMNADIGRQASTRDSQLAPTT